MTIKTYQLTERFTDDYLTREHNIAISTMNALSHNKLADRQAARAEYQSDMQNNPELVAERIEWLLAGNYGQGPHLIALTILESSDRYNKIAALSQTIAAFEWQCPARFARQAYLNLSPTEQETITNHIQRVIKEHRENHAASID